MLRKTNLKGRFDNDVKKPLKRGFLVPESRLELPSAAADMNPIFNEVTF